jgi:mannosyl-3-phosphoglycerate phosphatase
MTPPPLIVVTDLDATLLDEHTYSWAPATDAIRALATAGVPLVLCSSKTRVEMQPLAAAIGATAPLIVENGGAIIGRRDDGFVWPDTARQNGDDVELILGERRDALAPALTELAAATAVAVEPLSQMTVERLVELTGLSPESARLARAREFSEPFTTTSPAAAVNRLGTLAEARGLRVTRGGRFWHLTGATDKGRAVRILAGMYGAPGRAVRVAALGDAPNDREMLAAADVAIIVPRAGGPDARLVRLVPEARIAPKAGPAGWNAAVLRLLESKG